eukprot:Unigene5212_Nuclearia_a/m.15979 Unigene5212_Nuclearia_a/g.15979  ORF Unigene5212_Nuclearia_a/g.15979 Unigene5212_Nuclearia_a/m.15979 type:complete len:306 (-) Unigene5212_Nuclearia_a:346-1263(-)
MARTLDARAHATNTSTALLQVLAAGLRDDPRRRLGVEEHELGLVDIFARDLGARVQPRDDVCGREQLHGVPQRRAVGGLGESGHRVIRDGQALGARADLDDHRALLERVRQRADDREAVEQVHGNAVRRQNVLRSPDRAHAAVCRQHDDRRQRRLERAVEVGEALDVEHVHLVHKEHARHELRHAVLNVLVHNLVDLAPQLVGNLGLARLEQLIHHRHDVLASLRARVGHVEVVQRHVLDDLLLLVHITLWQRHVLLRLEVKLGRKRVRSADALAARAWAPAMPAAHPHARAHRRTLTAPLLASM